ncbi:acetylornithine transaminase [Aeromicrobium terrae]|uniref:Acetylornithine aminotransferase n=1 Tax=Aeromicrobium terrae TaxID=2498846 RepID=A0A5C8NPH1_9ACTN|nr:acetylornithine transaminase [Aeromicrobium terrae]TXL63017.1 acetylornithine transaminase [Aeromicrobium terrae]
MSFPGTAQEHTGQEWTERYQGALMNTFGPPQRVLVRGEGPYVWDVDGNKYLDLLGGIAVNALGHAHPALLKAVGEQLGTLGHVSNFFTSEPQVELAEKLLSLLGQDGPGGGAGPRAANGRVFFTSTGTEANEAAFKATRKTGRTTIVATEGSFHGRTMGALALTSKQAYREPFEPLPGDVRWVPYGDAAALESAVDETVAAVVVEPIQGEAGVVVPSDDYLAEARRITSEHGALLWIDEVQTGIGRTGAWFDHARSCITPDLVTVAKGLGGGIPIGACIALGDTATLLQPGNHGTTFGGNPVATSAALAVIETIEAEGLLENAREVGDAIRSGLADHPLVAETTGRGLLVGIVLTEPKAAEIQQAALDAGLIINNATPERLRLAPPLILTPEQADGAVKTLRMLLDEASS